MKNKFKKFCLLLGLMLPLSLSAAACGETPPPEDPDILSIELVAENADFEAVLDMLYTDYSESIVISESVIDIVVNYNDGSKATIKDGFTIVQPTTFYTDAANEFSVTYKDFTQQCWLNFNPLPAVSLEDAVVSGIETSIEYGEYINTDELMVTLGGVELNIGSDITYEVETNYNITTDQNKSYIIITSADSSKFFGEKKIEITINPKRISLLDYFDDMFWQNEEYVYDWNSVYDYWHMLHLKSGVNTWSYEEFIDVEMNNGQSFVYENKGTYEINVKISSKSDSYTIVDSLDKCEFTKTLKITPMNIASVESKVIDYETWGLQYNGAEKTPAIYGVVLDDHEISSQMYDVTYGNNVNACSWSGNNVPDNAPYFTITFKNNIEGSITQNFEISRASIGGCVFAWENVDDQYNPEFDYAYGSEIKPAFTLKYYGEDYELIDVPSDSYTIKYENNINVETFDTNNNRLTPSLTLTAKDGTNFVGQILEEFTIAPISVDINEFIEDIQDEFEYDRNSHKPSFTLLNDGNTVGTKGYGITENNFSIIDPLNGNTLQSVTDASEKEYKIIFINNSNYEVRNDITRTLKVNPHRIDASNFTGYNNVVSYTGKEIIFDIKLNDDLINEDEYTITHGKNVDVRNDAYWMVELNYNASKNFVITNGTYSDCHVGHFSIVPIGIDGTIIDENSITERTLGITKVPTLITNNLMRKDASNSGEVTNTKFISDGQVNIGLDAVEYDKNIFKYVYSDRYYDYFYIDHPGLIFHNSDTFDGLLPVQKQNLISNITINDQPISIFTGVDLSMETTGLILTTGDVLKFSLLDGYYGRLPGQTGAPTSSLEITVTNSHVQYRSISFDVFDSDAEDAKKIWDTYVSVCSSLATSVSLKANTQDTYTSYSFKKASDKTIIYTIPNGATTVDLKYETDIYDKLSVRINDGAWEEKSENTAITIEAVPYTIITVGNPQSVIYESEVTIIFVTEDHVSKYVEDFNLIYVKNVNGKYNSVVYKPYPTQIPYTNIFNPSETGVANYRTAFYPGSQYALVNVDIKLVDGYYYKLAEGNTNFYGIQTTGQTLVYNIYNDSNDLVDTITLMITHCYDMEEGYAAAYEMENGLTSYLLYTDLYDWNESATWFLLDKAMLNTIYFLDENGNVMNANADGFVCIYENIYFCVEDSDDYQKLELYEYKNNNYILIEPNSEGYVPVGNSGYYKLGLEFYKFIRSGKVDGTGTEMNIYEKVNKIEDIEYRLGKKVQDGTTEYGMAYAVTDFGANKIVIFYQYEILTTSRVQDILPESGVIGETIKEYFNISLVGESEDTIVSFVDYFNYAPQNGWHINGVLTLDQVKQAVKNINKEDVENGQYAMNLVLREGVVLNDIVVVDGGATTANAYIKLNVTITETILEEVVTHSQIVLIPLYNLA